MGRFLATLVLAGLAVGIVHAGEMTFALTSDNTTIKFTGTKPGGKHDGGFKKMTGTAKINGADITTLKVVVDIDVNSIWTDTQKVTDHLKTPDFFDAKTYPKAKFESSSIVKDGSGYKVTGKLTMHGKSKDVTFPAKIDMDAGKLTLTSSNFTINRQDWAINYKGVNDDITLNVSFNAKK